MKITRLQATDVHGYLPISIEFLEDLTFLTGLNGSGKTTALRLLMGLLAPSLDELVEISFSSALVAVTNEGKETTIRAVRSEEGLQLSISTEKSSFKLSTTDLQLLLDARPREERHTPLHTKASAHPVFQAIKKLSTPMFLGLDRRLNLEDADPDLVSRIRRRDLEYRHRLIPAQEVSIRTVTDAVLAEVNDLAVSALSEIRAAQERLDENLRNKILLDSFRYVSTEPGASSFPTRAALNSFRERQAAVEKAAAGLRLPVGELQSALTDFFERINNIVSALEEEQKGRQAAAKSKLKGKPQPPPQTSSHIVEWVMNSRQADRILHQIELLDEYVTSRAKLHHPIDRFSALVNGFLDQTGKKIMVTPRGDLRVNINNGQVDKRLFALSSGERQLVVMLAHLSLNKRLAGSGVFIVDEPELSLHIGWQEQFVDAIRTANPKVQLILATHSPAIILERTDNCRSLS